MVAGSLQASTLWARSPNTPGSAGTHLSCAMSSASDSYRIDGMLYCRVAACRVQGDEMVCV